MWAQAGPSKVAEDTVTRNPWLTSKPLYENKFEDRKRRAVGLDGVEPKYDIRSARGGRGGLVTAVRALWADQAPPATEKGKEKKSTPKDLMQLRSSPATSTPPPVKPKPKALSSAPTIATRASSSSSSSAEEKSKPNIIKAAHVPAVVSSSHAVPTISSTASLARPTQSRPEVSSERKERFGGAGRFSLARVAEEEATTPTPSKTTTPKPKNLPPRVKHGFSDLGAINNGPTSPKSPAAHKSEAIKGLRQMTSPPPTAEKKPSTTTEMAFGQAKLRDLIRKYQGGA